MNCQHVQQQLLIRQAGDWAGLRPHLDVCDRCSSIAKTIVQQEYSMYNIVNDHLDPRDFDEKWEVIYTESERTSRWPYWVQAAAATLVVAGVMALASQSGTVQSYSLGGAVVTAGPAAPADAIVVEINVGRSAIIEVPDSVRLPQRVSYGDPPVIKAAWHDKERDLYTIHGLGEGVASLVVPTLDGTEQRVDFHVLGPQSTPASSPEPWIHTAPVRELTIDVGEWYPLNLDRKPDTIATTNRAVAGLELVDGELIHLTGLEPGISEIVSVFDSPPLFEIVHVEVR